eukprot:COSAG04_NODE_11728_length_692_cov_0.908938_1_plen_23_part_10
MLKLFVFSKGAVKLDGIASPHPP